MKFCSIPGCMQSITEAQAETTMKLFGKEVCVEHEKVAAAEAGTHDKEFTIDTAPYVKCGFKIENGLAVKVVGQVEVTVDVAKVAAGKPKKETVQVGGYEYVFGQNPDVDKEIKWLFEMVAGKGGAKKETPANKTKNRDDSGAGVEQNQPDPVTPPQPNASGLFDLIKSYVGNDVLEVFGDSGTGKSKLVLELARQAIASGKTVFYLDTERNLTEEDVSALKGCQYRYTPVIEEINQISQKLPKVDLVIIDSIGFPVLTAYARMNMKQKGDALLKMIAIFGDLKEWAYRNNGVAVVINQPESDFNKEPGHLIRPFGDKSQFAAKEIWKTEVVLRGKTTKTNINAFRSQSLGHGTKIADMEVSEKGTIIIAVRS